MNLSLEGKKAVVTGAAGGLGYEITRALVNAGCTVMMTDLREENLKKGKEEFGENVSFITGDITDDAFCDEVALRCLEEFGSLDILVNNAGIPLKKGALETTKEEFMRIFEVNIYANLAMARACHELLKKSDCADIITICSSSGNHYHPTHAAYSASKFAQKALSNILNIEFFDEDIRVHTIYPSAVETPFLKKVRNDLGSNQSLKAEEVASLIVFILANRNNSVVDNVLIRRYTKRPDEN